MRPSFLVLRLFTQWRQVVTLLVLVLIGLGPVEAGVAIPEYPIHERGIKAEGTTMVGVTIGAGGEVISVELVKTSGYPNLDKAALAAVHLWRAHEKYSGRRVVVPVQFTVQAIRRR